MREHQESVMAGFDQRRLALARLSRAAVEAGLYDRNEIPEGGQDE